MEYGTGINGYMSDIFSATVRLKDYTFVLGGGKDGSQISEVYPFDNLFMRRIGSLPFQFQFGISLSYNYSAILCFPQRYENTCWNTSDMTKFNEMPKSKFEHTRGSIEIFNGNLWAIGGIHRAKETEWNDRKSTIEIFDTKQWTTLHFHRSTGTPFNGGSLFDFSTIVITNYPSDLLYIFGTNNNALVISACTHFINSRRKT